jgi:hypothetical protein
MACTRLPGGRGHAGDRRPADPRRTAGADDQACTRKRGVTTGDPSLSADWPAPDTELIADDADLGTRCWCSAQKKCGADLRLDRSAAGAADSRKGIVHSWIFERDPQWIEVDRINCPDVGRRGCVGETGTKVAGKSLAKQCAAVSIRLPVDECTTEPVQMCNVSPARKIGPTRGSGFTGPATGIAASSTRMLVARTGPAAGPLAATSNTNPTTIANVRIRPHDDGSATLQGASSAAIRVAEPLPGAETGSVRKAIECDRVRTHKGAAMTTPIPGSSAENPLVRIYESWSLSNSRSGWRPSTAPTNGGWML